jgi:retron-type reverse transcriptase
MQSHNGLWEKLISFKNLLLAYKKARKAKPSSIEVLIFSMNLERNLFALQNELASGTYRLSGYRCFTIFEPKKRTIKALPFKDRVVQHALCNLIEPIFDNTFINTSFACRKKKGTHKGLATIKKAVQSKFVNEGYALKCDVRKYFPTIDHSILKKILFERIKDKQICNLMCLIIDSDVSEFGINKGIPIGNLTSQLFANIYLNELDKFVKHKLKAKYYYRYVDDFLIFSDSKKKLHIFKKKIKRFLKTRLFLEIPKRKTNIYLIKDGVDFVGYKIFSSFVRLRKSNLTKFKKRTIYLSSLYLENKININRLFSSINSYLGYTMHADAYRVTSKILFDFNFLFLAYCSDSNKTKDF